MVCISHSTRVTFTECSLGNLRCHNVGSNLACGQLSEQEEVVQMVCVNVTLGLLTPSTVKIIFYGGKKQNQQQPSFVMR